MHERVPKSSCSACVHLAKSADQGAVCAVGLGSGEVPRAWRWTYGFGVCSLLWRLQLRTSVHLECCCIVWIPRFGVLLSWGDASVGTPAVINLYAYVTCSLRTDGNSGPDCAPGPVCSDFLVSPTSASQHLREVDTIIISIQFFHFILICWGKERGGACPAWGSQLAIDGARIRTGCSRAGASPPCAEPPASVPGGPRL